MVWSCDDKRWASPLAINACYFDNSCSGYDGAGFSAAASGAGLDACGVDPGCIQNGGIGPFGSPVANGGSWVDSVVGGGQISFSSTVETWKLTSQHYSTPDCGSDICTGVQEGWVQTGVETVWDSYTIQSGSGSNVFGQEPAANNNLHPTTVDKYNPMERRKTSFRDSKWFCSTHVTIDQATGQPGSHVDLFNPEPTQNQPSPTLFWLHFIYDGIPDYIYRETGMYPVPPGRSLCQ
jgi:hypothetical protein